MHVSPRFSTSYNFTNLLPHFNQTVVPYFIRTTSLVLAVYYNVIVTLLVISHVKAVFTDPGFIPLPSQKLSPHGLLSLKRNVSSGIQIIASIENSLIPSLSVKQQFFLK